MLRPFLRKRQINHTCTQSSGSIELPLFPFSSNSTAQKTLSASSSLALDATLLAPSESNENFAPMLNKLDMNPVVILERYIPKIGNPPIPTAKQFKIESDRSRNLHLPLSENPCSYCDCLFNHVADLANHLSTAHEIKERARSSNGQSFERDADDFKKIFICTECSTPLHLLDLQRHSYDCQAVPRFPLRSIGNFEG